ncbi:hypothetical protein GCM10007198_30200 [Microbacterium aerolatum]|uniref:Uncharacterized protein n=1 Tax=Microbacterium aerolatum TaxID=153731 RepID=A0A511AC62_9MICO|nr:hypothetical protein MAE01_01390 [Microbacterium aerolatum]GGB37609.1 hypothetical protein GCM10007198_30200 [Microbacterium aerolatum]
MAPEDVAELSAVRDAHRLLIDDRPCFGIGIQREQIRVAIEGEDDILKDV